MAGSDSDLSLAPGSGDLVVLRGEAVRQRRLLDRLFRRLARRDGAEEWEVPPLLPIAALERAGFMRAFPQHATFAAPLHSESLAEIGAAGAAMRAIGSADLLPPAHVLASAACYGLYPQLQDTTLQRPILVTLVSDCCRREDEYAAGRRQWSFRMREIVCLGPAAEVRAFLERWTRALQGLATDCGLPCELRPATDPFFQAADPRRLLQRLAPNKWELLWRGDLAVSSMNSHRNFFGEAFAIRGADGAPVHSACVAFGLDRWLHACRATFGDATAGWPAALVARSAP
jgi:hypothetical protein